ncbi:MAG: SpoIIE family protein phosphatase [bacterium]|nr:SpoIIE family protein phosphatase [bacterium]
MACATLLLTASGCHSSANTVDLEGWHFRPGFAPEFLTQDIEAPAWRPVSFPVEFRRFENLREHRGWVTVKTRLPKDPRLAAAARAAGLALYTGRSGDATVFYLNEQRVATLGSVDPYRSGHELRLLTALPDVRPDPSGTDYLTIALYSPGEFGFRIVGPVRIGPADEIFALARRSETIELLLLTIYLVVGAYHLLLAAWRPRDLHNLYFGAFAIILSAYWFFRSDSSQTIFAEANLLRIRLDIVSLLLLTPLFVQFLSQVLDRRHDRPGMIYAALCGALALLTVFGDYATMKGALSAWQASLIFMIPYAAFYIVRAVLRRQPEAIFLVVGVLVLFAAVIHDILAARYVIQSEPVARYAFLGLVVGIAVMLASRFMLVHNQVEELNASLEQKVEQRTEELQAALSESRRLRTMQDGDYFLTSLLLSPLSGKGPARLESISNSKPEPVQVATLDRQYKKFAYKNQFREIGGDFSSAHRLRLNDQDYAVFLNADAMGKSMQGAGGALVLGTSFNSIINRTQNNSGRQTNRDPELWLNDCYQEIQSIFLTFNGSMLISLTLGLVHESSGALFWINADHPPTVLYRDGRAAFIENEAFLQKIGMDLGEKSVARVNTLTLRPDDLIITGSDGRDDILLGLDPEGNRILNADDDEFLGHVAKGGGDLDEIHASILARGQLTDDLSLVRVAFREDFPARPELDRLRSDAANEIQTAARDERWQELARLLQRYEARFALESPMLALLVDAHHKAGDSRAAARAAKRWLLRQPDSPEAPEAPEMRKIIAQARGERRSANS